ncbi:MAG TPA: outer membrane lipoprotein carrier protein LolA [Candidatus Binataceae bacterium]|nr:outer membrane lipoprotein carrier protein LolA [Candidatus Binataceae bacterium]
MRFALSAAAAAIVAAVSVGSVVTAAAHCKPIPASTAADSAPSLETTLTRLQQRYDCSRSLQANFDEQLSSPGGMARTRKGTVYFRKVGRMRWEFAAPSEGTVVSDGTTVYDYEKDLNQVVELPVSKALKSSATAFLLGLGNIRRDFKVSLPPESSIDGLIYVILVPKSGGDTMELGLDPKSYDIVKFKLTNQIGGVTELRFSDIRTNVALDDSLFAFTVPEGADVVRPQKN